MAVYDLEEQDQLEDLKAWWAQWGNYVAAAVIAVSLAVVGVQGWRWWQHNKAEQASMLYSTVSTAARANDLPRAKDAMTQLADKYSGTAYAPRAAMVIARMLFDSGDKAGAKTQLQWVVDQSGEDELKQIARYRLAEVQFDEKQYDDALRTLDARHDDAFGGLYADLRGDILAAAKRVDEARVAYQNALAKLDAKSQYRNYVEVKLNALGGPLTPSTAAGAVTPPPTVPSAAAPAAPSAATVTPAPSAATVTPAPSAAIVTPAPTAAKVTPTPSPAPAAPTPTNAAPTPASTPAMPAVPAAPPKATPAPAPASAPAPPK